MIGSVAFMRELVKRKAFDAELHQAIRSGVSFDDVEHLFYLLAKYDTLPDGYDEHPLRDNWQGYLDCHLAGDLVVIYKRTTRRIILARIGTHTEIFRHRKKRGLWGWLKGD